MYEVQCIRYGMVWYVYSAHCYTWLEKEEKERKGKKITMKTSAALAMTKGNGANQHSNNCDVAWGGTRVVDWTWCLCSKEYA